jgi:hypothetical protein
MYHNCTPHDLTLIHQDSLCMLKMYSNLGTRARWTLGLTCALSTYKRSMLAVHFSTHFYIQSESCWINVKSWYVQLWYILTYKRIRLDAHMMNGGFLVLFFNLSKTWTYNYGTFLHTSEFSWMHALPSPIMLEPPQSDPFSGKGGVNKQQVPFF